MFGADKKHILFCPLEKWHPLHLANEKPRFTFASYSYTSQTDGYVNFPADLHVDLGETQGLGHSLYLLCRLIAEHHSGYDFLSLFNGDVLFDFASINRMYRIADALNLNWYQPALSHSSFYSHDFTLTQPGLTLHKVQFCELMCFTIPMQIVQSIANHNLYSLSGWGMDWHLIPYLLSKANITGDLTPYVIDACQVDHLKELEDGRNKVYSNGLTAYEELKHLERAISTLATQNENQCTP